jgi:hypothetical protein
MNKQNKPAVVAKTAPKKRGRPAGTKNKLKTLNDVKVGEALSWKDFNRLASKTVPLVDWEKLAKQLQVALAAEIKDGDTSQRVVEDLCKELGRKRTFWERLVCLATGQV